MFTDRVKSSKLAFAVIIGILSITLIGIPEPVSAVGFLFASPTGTNSDACTYDDPCSLQHAVDIATTQWVYAAAGTYYPSALPSDQVLLINKSVRVYGGWDGVTGGDPGIPDPETYVSILDGQDARQGVTIMLDMEETVVFSGFTIRNGNATGKVAICSAPNAAGCGGGIMVVGGTATIEHCIIEDNIASTTTDAMYRTGYGGGIYIQNPVDVTIRDNLIRSNDASTAAVGPVGNNGEGGGIYVRGAVAAEDLTITENEISENNAAAVSYVGWGVGLSIYNSHGTVSQNDIHDNNPNLSAFGGGIYSSFSDLSISGNRFINNQGGEALYLEDNNGFVTANIISNPAITNGVFLNVNSSGRSSTLVNNIISQNGQSNIVLNGGDGFGVTANIYHNTLDNAPFGLFLINYATVNISNSIVSHHSYTGIYKNPAGTSNTVNVNYTLFHGNTADGTWDMLVHPIPTGDPSYVDAAGGDYHLQPNSAARDVAASAGYGIDFEGDDRPMGTNLTPYDVGADEFWWKTYLPMMIKP